MYVYRISSYLIFVLIQTIIVVGKMRNHFLLFRNNFQRNKFNILDPARTEYPSTSRQMCTKVCY